MKTQESEDKMSKMIRVAVDAMGGDNAPGEIVKGTVEAVLESPEIMVYLVGREELITKELSAYNYPKEQITVVNATEEITCEEAPVVAVKKKKDSSIVVALNLVKERKADAFVSAGSTGAVLAGGLTIVRRIRGVERTPLAPLIPTEKGVSLLVDCGANVDAKPSQLVQFAKMGSIYMKYVVGIENPRVALVNIGMEEGKGNMLVKDTYPLLKECKDINFTGFIEAREIPHGEADVIVCDAFVGNVILKLYEGLAATLISKIKAGLKSTTVSKIGAAMAKPALKKTLKSFDTAQYGGAPMLGLNGLVVKTHGSAKSVEVKNSIRQCALFIEQEIEEKIREHLVLEEEVTPEGQA